MLKKLRIKFILVNMSIVLAMLLIIFSMLFHFTKVDLGKEARQLLHSVAQEALQTSKLRPVETNLQYFTVRITAWDEVTSSGYTAYDLDDQDFIRDVVQLALSQREDEGHLEKYGLDYYRIMTRDVIVVSFVDQSGQNAALESLLVTALIIGGVSMLVFFVISLFLARWIVKPVDKAWTQQKQFISDASHELKTPLAVIMANSELLNGTQDTQLKDQYSANIFTMSLRMRDLVDGMLNLSRVDNGQIKKTFTQVDLSKLVSDAVLPFEPLFFEKGLTLQSAVQPGITVKGNDIYLSQVVQSLLDNAIKYSAPGIVELQLQKYGRSQTLLTVSNPGNPIAPQDVQRIFDRFYRTDEARTGSGSFGLGLAIAKSMVEEHGGRIWVESNDTGNCFCILLPCG